MGDDFLSGDHELDLDGGAGPGCTCGWAAPEHCPTHGPITDAMRDPVTHGLPANCRFAFAREFGAIVILSFTEPGRRGADGEGSAHTVVIDRAAGEHRCEDLPCPVCDDYKL